MHTNNVSIELSPEEVEKNRVTMISYLDIALGDLNKYLHVPTACNPIANLKG